MSDLHSTLAAVLSDRYATNAARVRELAAPVGDEQFWQKPFPFGNSFGHLVLHLTGNLNYYIGAQIAKTGYVRDRPREFNDPNPPSKDEALQTVRCGGRYGRCKPFVRNRPEIGREVTRVWDERLQSARHDHAVRRAHAAPHWADDLSRLRVAAAGEPTQ